MLSTDSCRAFEPTQLVRMAPLVRSSVSIGWLYLVVHSVQGGTSLPYPKEGYFGLSKPVAVFNVFNMSEPSLNCSSESKSVTVVWSVRELAI